MSSESWRKSFPWSAETHHGKSSIDEEGECSTDPAIMSIVECGIGMSPGQEGIVLRVKTPGLLESAEVGLHRLSGSSEKYKVKAQKVKT